MVFEQIQKLLSTAIYVRNQYVRNQFTLLDFLEDDADKPYLYQDYLVSSLAKDKDLVKLVRKLGHDGLTERSYRTLTETEHTYRADINAANYTESPENIRELNNAQLLRVLFIMEGLKNQETVNTIGALLENSMKANYAEHGGLIIFDNEGNLAIQPVRSEVERVRHNKEELIYLLPYGSVNKPKVAMYHFHAVREDCSIEAGPSDCMDVSGKRGSDLGYCQSQAQVRGEEHNIVITKLEGTRFNVDYYGGIKTGEHVKLTVLDLGNYEYRRS